MGTKRHQSFVINVQQDTDTPRTEDIPYILPTRIRDIADTHSIPHDRAFGSVPDGEDINNFEIPNSAIINRDIHQFIEPIQPPLPDLPEDLSDAHLKYSCYSYITFLQFLFFYVQYILPMLYIFFYLT